MPQEKFHFSALKFVVKLWQGDNKGSGKSGDGSNRDAGGGVSAEEMPVWFWQV